MDDKQKQEVLFAWLHLVIKIRRQCRQLIFALEFWRLKARKIEKQAKQYRQTENSFMIRRAELLENGLPELETRIQAINDLLLENGKLLMDCSSSIDLSVPQSMLLDLLAVNRVDRGSIRDGDGIIEIVYAHALEESATFRGSDWKQGPLAQAVMAYFTHQMIHNEEFKQKADECLFGKGGMFEFLPFYKIGGDGQMMQQPPRLRLADECDIKNNYK